MATERQIAANRRNAQKSTGPRTPEGKARSSRNAVKHGIYSQYLLLTPEDRAGIRATLAAYRADLRPVGPLQRALVFQMAIAEWGARLQARAETRILTTSIHHLQQAGHRAPSLQASLENLSGLNYLGRIQARFDRIFSRALNDLRRLQRRTALPQNKKMTNRTQANSDASPYLPGGPGDSILGLERLTSPPGRDA